MKKSLLKLSLLPVSLLVMMPAMAATPVNLMDQPTVALTSLITGKASSFVEVNRSVDVKKTLHVRIKQTYLGHKVWGGDGVIHIPHAVSAAQSLTNVVAAVSGGKGFMNGTMYQDLNVDLANAPAIVFEKAQAEKALTRAIENYQHTVGINADVKNPSSELIVYVDQSNKAHWAYNVQFEVAPLKAGALPAKPVMILDAISLNVYKQWDNIQTDSVDGGGYGGNKKMGKMVYDGIGKNLAKLMITRDVAKSLCTLNNSEVTVVSDKTNKLINFNCSKIDSAHKVYWDADLDKVNDGYSPGNDALFGGQVIKHMYQDWYHLPVLVDANKKPMVLKMVVHSYMDNAYWDGEKMTFGDGISMFYPLTSLGVAAHEISHGFTEQHSGLNYSGQSGGMNESFSDMAAQAAEFYAYGAGKNSWQIGPEIFKQANRALRYMDLPSKDCDGGKPGHWCSIDDASQYTSSLDVHYSSGVYNHFFYILGTTKGWDARKAFDIMVQANTHYWIPSTTFISGACGVLQAAADLGKDLSAVKAAFKGVKIDTSSCKIKSVN